MPCNHSYFELAQAIRRDARFRHPAWRPCVAEIEHRYVMTGAYPSQDVPYCYGDYLVGDAYVDVLVHGVSMP